MSADPALDDGFYVDEGPPPGLDPPDPTRLSGRVGELAGLFTHAGWPSVDVECLRGARVLLGWASGGVENRAVTHWIDRIVSGQEIRPGLPVIWLEYRVPATMREMWAADRAATTPPAAPPADD